MRPHLLAIAATVAAAGCYTHADVVREVNASWSGRARAELEVALGAPTHAAPQGDGQLLRWTHRGTQWVLPSIDLDARARIGGEVRIGPGGASVDLAAAAVGVRAGRVDEIEVTHASAVVDGGGRVLVLDAGFAVGGDPPRGNWRTGFLLGAMGGPSALDDATDTLPGLSAYLGWMVGPRVGVVGSFTFANGRAGDGEHVPGLAWSAGVQYWPLERVALRAGPAIVLDWDPAVDGASAALGVATAASVAVVRAGAFVLDVRLDATVATGSALGVLGLGVHLN